MAEERDLERVALCISLLPLQIFDVVDQPWRYMTNIRDREIRACFDAQTITVYQAYPAAIAKPAAARNSLSKTPFKLSRMTWIKPSFYWMMYRCGWASKPNQENVLAIKILRSGFEEALSQACVSHFGASGYDSYQEWLDRKGKASARVQWDPERSSSLTPLPYRSLQLGISGALVQKYVFEWTVHIEDITDMVHDLAKGAPGSFATSEELYPLPPNLKRIIGASQ